MISMTAAMAVGPVIGGLLIDAAGFRAAYAVDAVITTAALWGFGSLPPIPPDPEARPRGGLRSVVDGLAALATMPNVRMTFIADIAVMVLAQPLIFNTLALLGLPLYKLLFGFEEAENA